MIIESIGGKHFKSDIIKELYEFLNDNYGIRASAIIADNDDFEQCVLILMDGSKLTLSTGWLFNSALHDCNEISKIDASEYNKGILAGILRKVE